jgi:hypothetical protein
MQIKSLLELTLTKNISEIAKDHLAIGEKPLREALKVIGCRQNKGKRGWFYNGEQTDILDKSIYDFVPTTTRRGKTKGTDTISNASTSTSRVIVTDDNASTNTVVSNDNTSTNKVVSEIQSLLNTKSKVDRLYKGMYLDNDIANFLDNVPNGNKSDIVNKIMRAYLIENGFL